MKKFILKWAPRVFGILLIGLWFVFSLDVFSMNEIWYRVILAFLIHNIPSIVLLVALIFSWKKPIVGANVFIGVGVFISIYFFVENGFEAIVTILMFRISSVVIGLGFLFDHIIE